MILARLFVLMGENKCDCSVLVSTLDEKGPLGKPGLRWGHNVEMVL